MGPSQLLQEALIVVVLFQVRLELVTIIRTCFLIVRTLNYATSRILLNSNPTCMPGMNIETVCSFAALAQGIDSTDELCPSYKFNNVSNFISYLVFQNNLLLLLLDVFQV